MSDKTNQRAISPADAVANAMKLLQHNPVLAERQAQEILKVLPNDARAVFILGAARRRAGDGRGARAVLEYLTKALPQSAIAHQELGLALAGLGESAAAIATLQHAAVLNQSARQAWQSAEEQIKTIGDGAIGADDAAALDQRLRDAADALRDGRVRDGERLLRQHLRVVPDDAAALRMLAEALTRLGRWEDAEDQLARCLEVAPDFALARHMYALVLYQQTKVVEASAQLEQLLAISPKDSKYLTLMAGCLAFLGEFDRVVEIFEGLLAMHPRQSKLWINYGQMLRIIGRLDDATQAFRQAIALRAEAGEAYWSLADLKTVRLTEADLAAMRRHVDNNSLPAEDRIHLHYALGKALEDLEAWEESFAHYARGAKLRRKALPHDPDENTVLVEYSRALFTKEFFANRVDGGLPDPAPIFVVGLPRSGSTLIEQILSCHPLVEGTMELAELTHITGRLARAGRKGEGPGYPRVVGDLSAADRTALGEDYIKRTARYRKLGRPYFVDKMPSNFYHIGLIQLILPNAKIIDVRRHPMAACFSSFKQHFYHGQNFTYSQTDLARYYRDYLALMDHFDRVLRGRVHRVIYEDMVEDSETEIRRLLAACGLDFAPECLRYWETDRSVSTHSSEQVRRPIFREGLERWRSYAPWIDELRNGLDPVLETWRGETPRYPSNAA